jgi:uncharacterized protein YndB with AHSA1/START domain
MSNLQSPPVAAIVLRRTYGAPRERVFAAWTNPEIALRLYAPGETKATDVQMDVRPGGNYRIAMLSPEMGPLVVRGTYREVKAPERLVMTWSWEEDDPAEERESLLTLDFHERDGGTEFVLTHELLATVESRDRHEVGWTSIVDKLAKLVEA